jgi:chromosome partitioning protein
MPARSIITFASSKGGVGKSTACAAVAAALAKRGCAIAVIDVDQNQTLHRWFSTHKPPIPTLTPQAIPNTRSPIRIRNKSSSLPH